MDRIFRLQAGTFRLLLVIYLIIIMILFIFNDGFNDVRKEPSSIMGYIAVCGIIWIIYWLIVRILLWVYDGFKE